MDDSANDPARPRFLSISAARERLAAAHRSVTALLESFRSTEWSTGNGSDEGRRRPDGLSHVRALTEVGIWVSCVRFGDSIVTAVTKGHLP